MSNLIASTPVNPMRLSPPHRGGLSVGLRPPSLTPMRSIMNCYYFENYCNLLLQLASLFYSTTQLPFCQGFIDKLIKKESGMATNHSEIQFIQIQSDQPSASGASVVTAGVVPASVAAPPAVVLSAEVVVVVVVTCAELKTSLGLP